MILSATLSTKGQYGQTVFLKLEGNMNTFLLPGKNIAIIYKAES